MKENDRTVILEKKIAKDGAQYDFEKYHPRKILN